MLLWLSIAHADEPAPSWSGLAATIGFTGQFSTIADNRDVVLEAGPLLGITHHQGTARFDLRYGYNNNFTLWDGENGRFSTHTLSGAMMSPIHITDHPVVYIGGGAAMSVFDAEYTEIWEYGRVFEHDEHQTTVTVHGALAWRVIHREQLAVELDYTLRYNFLQDSIISRGHHILGLTLWMSMEALDVGVLK